jgi:hypothetical protein
MRRTELLQEIRRMQFKGAYSGWRESRFTQEQAAEVLRISVRTFRQYIDRYVEEKIRRE